MPRKVAILGANGFVGSRLVEIFHLKGLAQIIPVVRRVGGMARPGRFNLDTKLADVRHLNELTEVLAGCDSVVDCTVGTPEAIEAGVLSLIPAAKRAGVRRVIYLSTASVHGQNPTPGTDENTPLSDRHEIPYNNAKVRAERQVLADAKRLGIELFVLRPSIVFGPRDRWISTLVKELEKSLAWVIGEGKGICNTIYVDNLVEAIRCCVEAPSGASGQPYLVGDAETVTWGDVYFSTAKMWGLDHHHVRQIPVPAPQSRVWSDRFNEIRIQPFTQRLIASVPSRFKSVVKGAVSGFRPRFDPNPWQLECEAVTIRPSREMILLQQCGHRFPQARAAEKLGYKPVVSFEEGLRRTMAWIRWARS